jgi:octaprenyl-diphosphate synthase
MIQNSGGLQDAREAAHQEALRAIAALEAFPANAHTDALRGLAQSLLTRRN